MENFTQKKESLTKEFQELTQIILKADTRQKEILGIMKFIEEIEPTSKENTGKDKC